ncbi:hypothetical protein [Nannocystis pusilla]|uniref:hypothetical protein n=1 Tax=Nannocystis pusilla TaxID=889268 RepID=UPI003DA5A617
MYVAPGLYAPPGPPRISGLGAGPPVWHTAQVKPSPGLPLKIRPPAPPWRAGSAVYSAGEE